MKDKYIGEIVSACLDVWQRQGKINK